MNKKNKKVVKISIILCTLIIPMAMLFGFLIPNGKADENIPEDPYVNPQNEWHWEVSVGDRLIYELEFTYYSLINPTQTFASKDILILDIAYFDNDTVDYMGPTEMSSVYAWMKYDNGTGSLLNKGSDPVEIAKFGFDPDGYPYKEKYAMTELILPFIFPINGTKKFEANVMADIFKNTALDPLTGQGFINEFDDYDSITGQNKIWFKNTDEGYYLNATYYDNGTLNEGMFKIALRTETQKLDSVFMGRYKRVFNYNVTDEIEWGVKAGDIFYMGMSSSGEEESFYNETKIEIIGIFKQYFEVPEIFDGGDGYPLQFDLVVASLSLWDSNNKIYVPVYEIGPLIIGIANNFYPMYYPYMFGMGGDGYGFGGGGGPLLVMPNNTQKEDLSFWWNNITCFSLFFTEAIVTDNSIEMTSFFPGLRLNWIFNDTTGITKLLYLTMPSMDGGGNGGGPLFSTFVAYQKYKKTFQGSAAGFELQSDLVGNNKVELNFTSGTGGDVYWAVIPENPLGNAPIPSSNPDLPLYIDVYGDFEPTGEPNMTIYYDPTQLNGIPEDDLVVYWANFSGQRWEIVDEVILHDLANNKLVINVTYPTFFFALGNKDMTSTVNWSVLVGEEIYAGSSGTDNVRITITKMNITEYNITALMEFSIPDWPQIMNFSNIYGKIEIWNAMAEVWELEYDEILIASANNYMPIGIPMFGGEGEYVGVLMPNGTTGEDLKVLFGFFMDPYYDQTYGHDFIILKDPSSGRYIKANFTVEDGRIIYVRGWFPNDNGGEFFSFYRLNMTTLTNPQEEFWCVSELVDPNIWKVDINLTLTPDIHLGWAILPDNPTNSTMWNFLPENISIYICGYVNDTNGISEGNFSIKYNKAILKACGINESDLLPYAYNFEHRYWQPIPESYWELDGDNDRLIVTPYGGYVFTIGTNMLSQVEWYYEEGDIFYLGSMDSEIKIQIHEINESAILNITDLYNGEIDMQTFGFPDNQTFSNVWADVYMWNPITHVWDYDDLYLVAAANNYWPFAPPKYFEYYGRTDSIPFIMPMETTGEDMVNIMKVFMEDMMFDTILNGTNFIYLSNSTNSYYMNFTINSETGIARNLWGYIYEDNDWHYFSFFFKHNITLTSGYIELDNYLVPSIDMYAIIVSSGCEFLYAMLSANPTDKSTPASAGTPLFYLDVMILNKTEDTFSINVTFILPSKYNIRYFNTECYWIYNKSEPEERRWISYPLGGGASIIRDYTENSLTIIIKDEKGPIVGINAFMYNPPRPSGAPGAAGDDDDDDDDEGEIIPGYDISILIATIALFSVVIILNRRKKI